MIAGRFLRYRLLGTRITRCFSADYINDIAEFNKEMETIFGQPSADYLRGSAASCEPSSNFQEGRYTETSLTHVDSTGQAQMVDVSSKTETKRVALATCRVLLGPKVFDLVASNQIGKGDVLNIAKVAGITGAKQTSNLIPLCHNINLSHIRVDLTLNTKKQSVDIETEASTTAKTGVEMEAMTAAAIAGLTVYDMCKAASKDIRVTDICLQHKSGGKSGDWSRDDNRLEEKNEEGGVI